MALASSKDLTKGGVAGNLLRFTVPFMLAFLLQVLYGTVDVLVIGRFGGASNGVSAVASGSEVMHLLASLIMGLTTGATVLIGRYFGAGDKEGVNHSIGMALSLAAIVAVAMTAVMVPMVPTIARWLRTPPEAYEATVTYATICSWGIVFIFGYNALSAVFRGLGNSAAPLLFVGIACVVNVFGDLLLVVKCRMGVAGVAYSTIASQGLSMLFALLFLHRSRSGFSFRLKYFGIRLHHAWQFARIGVPIGLQSIMISLSFIFIFTIVNTMGVSASAAYGICSKLNGFAMLPAIAFSMAISAITAQNIGAGLHDRALASLKYALLFTMSFGACALLLLQLFPEEAAALFLDRNSPGADRTLLACTQHIRSFSWEFILVPIVFCTNGFFNGCGRSFFSMANNLCSTFLVRVPVSWFFSTMAGATLFHVGLAAPLASLTSNIVALAYLASGRWRPPTPDAPPARPEDRIRKSSRLKQGKVHD